MGKDQELLEAARSGNVSVVEKILGQRAKRSGPLARYMTNLNLIRVENSFCFKYTPRNLLHTLNNIKNRPPDIRASLK